MLGVTDVRESVFERSILRNIGDNSVEQRKQSFCPSWSPSFELAGALLLI